MNNIKKSLFVCNTVYQVLVAQWIAYHTLPGWSVDFVISNHMNGGQEIANNISKLTFVNEVFYVQTREYCHFKEALSKRERIFIEKHPDFYLKKYVRLNGYYEQIFVANLDRFSQLLFAAICNKQKKKPRLILFEDGISTYSLLFKQFYDSTRNPHLGLTFRSKMALRLFPNNYIFNNITYALVFCPELMSWTPSENRKLDKINSNDKNFIAIVNKVFGYSNDANEYDKPYIFMEESYFADGIDVGDIEVVNQLAKIVGKNNIMVKIHPRNPINRFRELGYKTNSNTSIPWEVICLNMSGLREKKLITISSASIVMPIILFGVDVKTCSLYGLLNDDITASKVHPLLWKATKLFYEKNRVYICNASSDIKMMGD